MRFPFSRKGPTAAERGIPAYTDWDDFVADEHDPAEDGDDSVHHEALQHLVPEHKREVHLKEQS